MTLDLVELGLEHPNVNVRVGDVVRLDGRLRNPLLVLVPSRDGVGRDAVEEGLEDLGWREGGREESVCVWREEGEGRGRTVLGGGIAEECFGTRVERVLRWQLG